MRETGLNFGVLGPLQLSVEGTPVPLGAPKQRAVLAMLVINRNRPVGVESLINAVWDESPVPAARASIHSYVSNLRRLLGNAGIDTPTVLPSAPPGYRLNVADADCDLGRFTVEKTAGFRAAAAENAIEWNSLVPQDKVRPTVEHGWITLNGEVEWDYQRRAAEKSLRNLLGVTGVTNLVHVTPSVSASQVDRKIHDALLRQADRESRKIDVSVAGSQVTLEGTVHSWAERVAAQGAAYAAPGVATVVNHLRIGS